MQVESGEGCISPGIAFEMNASASGDDRDSEIVVVTACTQRYLDDGRLKNLIGSVHLWEKEEVRRRKFCLLLGHSAITST